MRKYTDNKGELNIVIKLKGKNRHNMTGDDFNPGKWDISILCISDPCKNFYHIKKKQNNVLRDRIMSFRTVMGKHTPSIVNRNSHLI